MSYTVVSTVDNGLQYWVKDTKEQASQLVRTLSEGHDEEPDILVFPCEPLNLTVKTTVELG